MRNRQIRSAKLALPEEKPVETGGYIGVKIPERRPRLFPERQCAGDEQDDHRLLELRKTGPLMSSPNRRMFPRPAVCRDRFIAAPSAGSAAPRRADKREMRGTVSAIPAR